MTQPGSWFSPKSLSCYSELRDLLIAGFFMYSLLLQQNKALLGFHSSPPSHYHFLSHLEGLLMFQHVLKTRLPSGSFPKNISWAAGYKCHLSNKEKSKAFLSRAGETVQWALHLLCMQSTRFEPQHHWSSKPH